jgi:hypothetical protein
MRQVCTKAPLVTALSVVPLYWYLAKSPPE